MSAAHPPRPGLAQLAQPQLPTRPPRSPPGSWRLLAPALVVWAVTAAMLGLPGAGAVVALSAAVLGGIFIAVLAAIPSTRGWPVAGALLLLCGLLVVVGMRVESAERGRADPVMTAASLAGTSMDFSVRLSAYPRTQLSARGDRHWVRADAQMPSGVVPVLLWLDEPPAAAQFDRWGPGLMLEVTGRPQSLASTDDAAFAVSVDAVAAVAEASLAARLSAVAASIRTGLREVAALVPGASLVPGFAVGDTTLVTAVLEQAMLESSLTHLTAVSGANCALVTGAVVWLLSKFGVGRRVRLAAAGVALLGFVGLIGPDASVQRAAVMAAVLLISGFGGRRAASLPALGIAIVVLIVMNPWQAVQAGFALSVAATAGILLLATPLSEWFRRRARIPRMLALPVAVALAAQLACGPLLLLLQPGIPAVGVLANVIAAPAAPLGTGLGLLAALTVPVAPGIAHSLVVAASLPARWVEATATVTAELPLARWPWPDGWGGAALLTLCQAGVIMAWAIHRGHVGLPGGVRVTPRAPWQPSVPPPKAVQRVVAALIASSLGLAVALTWVVPSAERLGVPNGWAIVACDVGQGDALLIRDPAVPEQTMLVDTGDDPQLLQTCLDRFGVHRISVLVLSHDDRDHVGALMHIAERVDAALISPTVGGETLDDREVVQQLRAAHVPFAVSGAGDTAALDPHGLRWEVLGPRVLTPPDTNAASLVMRVQVAESSVLLLGDTGAEEHEALLRAGVDLSAEVLKVAHHGSRDQSAQLAREVGAQWALISVGQGNRHGHPARETLADLALAGSETLRTDEHGSIALIPQAEGEWVPWVERARNGLG